MTMCSLIVFCVAIGVGSAPIPFKSGDLAMIDVFVGYLTARDILFSSLILVSVILAIPRILKERLVLIWLVPIVLISAPLVSWIGDDVEIVPMERPQIGILLDEDYINSSVVISGVINESPAVKRVSKKGDVISAIDGNKIGKSGVLDVHKNIDASGDSVEMTIQRNGKELYFEISKNNL